MRVVLYARVSTEEQREAGTSESQLSRLRQMAQALGWDVVQEISDEAISGIVPMGDRPRGRRLLDCEADLVAVYRLDRLSRSLRGLLEVHDALAARGAGIYSVQETFDTSTPLGKMVFQILGAFAELEHNTIRERTASGIDRVTRTGKWVNGPLPPGYEVDAARNLVLAHDSERWAQVFHRMAEGSTAVREYRRLVAEEVPADRRYLHATLTGEWTYKRLVGLLHSPVYKGVQRTKLSDGSFHEAECPATVSTEVWDAVQAKLTDNRRLADRNAVRHYPLRGLLKCAQCGLNLVGQKADQRNVYYRCNARDHDSTVTCHAPAVRAADLEAAVWAFVRDDLLAEPERVIARVQELLDEQKPAPPEEARRALASRVAKLQDQRQRSLDLYRERLATLDETTTSVKALDAQIAGHLADMQALDTQASIARADWDAGQIYLARLRQHQGALVDPDAQEGAIRDLVSRIVVDSAAGTLVVHPFFGADIPTPWALFLCVKIGAARPLHPW